MKKILVVNMNYLGDALMTTPAHAALRRAHPNAQIDAIAGAKAGYGAYDILVGNPDIDRLIPRVSGGALKRCWQLWFSLITGKYDAVVILPAISAYNAAAALAMTPVRVVGRRVSLDEHMCDSMLTGLRPIIAQTQVPRKLILRVTDEDRGRAFELLLPIAGHGPIVGVNLGASRPQKRWPIAGYSKLIKDQVDAGRVVALIGSGNVADKAAAARILESASGPNVLDLTGKTSVRDLAAVIQACNVLVTVDTGAMHIAAAVSTPVVALFGSTSPAVVGPYCDTPSRVLYKKLECSPCNNHPTCGGLFMCMSNISPSEVSDAVQELLAEGQASAPVAAAR